MVIIMLFLCTCESNRHIEPDFSANGSKDNERIKFGDTEGEKLFEKNRSFWVVNCLYLTRFVL